MTTIIAFAGRKQSGKTTCSVAVERMFKSQHIDAKIYNFADILKQDICMNMLGLTHDQCYGSDEDKNTLTTIQWKNIPGFNLDASTYENKIIDPEDFLTARRVMEIVGTDIFRKMKNNIWANAAINKIKIEKPEIAIIADCRFPNEVDIVKQNNGMVIKLLRNPHDSDHASETALDGNNYNESNFDIVIDNRFCSIAEQFDLIFSFLSVRGMLFVQ